MAIRPLPLGSSIGVSSASHDGQGHVHRRAGTPLAIAWKLFRNAVKRGSDRLLGADPSPIFTASANLIRPSHGGSSRKPGTGAPALASRGIHDAAQRGHSVRDEMRDGFNRVEVRLGVLEQGMASLLALSASNCAPACRFREEAAGRVRVQLSLLSAPESILAAARRAAKRDGVKLESVHQHRPWPSRRRP